MTAFVLVRVTGVDRGKRHAKARSRWISCIVWVLKEGLCCYVVDVLGARADRRFLQGSRPLVLQLAYDIR